MNIEDEKKYGRIQIRASICSVNQTVLEIMSQKEKIPIGRIIDKALLSDEKFLHYHKKVKKLYYY